jgi:SNF2 family DNA or RNA helicase
MAWLIERLRKIRAGGEKVIIFTEFRDIQRMLQRYVGEEFGIRVAVVNGDTSVSGGGSSKSRQGIIDAFQSSAGFNVIILSTTAVGFGVNVQAANHVIHYTRSWNPAKEDQATDRAYRIGQDKQVFVYCPTVTSERFITFEAKLDTLLEAKRRLAGDMLNGADDIALREWENVVLG